MHSEATSFRVLYITFRFIVYCALLQFTHFTSGLHDSGRSFLKTPHSNYELS